MKRFSIISFLVFLHLISNAQNTSEPIKNIVFEGAGIRGIANAGVLKSFEEQDSIKATYNALNVEFLGIAGYGYLNYERIIFKNNDIKFSGLLGITSNNLTDYTDKFNPDIIIPISLNTFYGKNHNIEFGIGQTISFIIKADTETFTPKRFTNFHSNLTLGYRYQKPNGGPVFKVHYNPILEFNKNLKHWGGISFGHAF